MPREKKGKSNKSLGRPDSQPTVKQPAEENRFQDIERTIAAAPPRKPEEIRAAEAEVHLEWNIGDVILDLYEVKGIHKGGGMGLVYRVSHRGWNIDLAVKSPRADFFKTEEQKENFVRECETWINLGLHPHTVSCYYVRTLGGIPRIFAEYVEGGSLSEWIKERRLYEGGHEKALERILDIAIQFAWGLHYAHEQGLIHQDVKPANVMMTPDDTAKVTDFGLAKARGLTGEGVEVVPDRSVLVSAGEMTPAYCSPEQARKEKLSRKTDIWSWGVSMLEMFMGEVIWGTGQAAAEVLENYVETNAEDEAIPRMPADLVELLKQCFQRDPDNRLESMHEIVSELKRSYQRVAGKEYARIEPKAADLLADGLNNRAVSMLDLGRQDEAEKLFDDALKSDPHHPETTYNRGLLLWRSGRMTDDFLVGKLEELSTTHEKERRQWRDDYYLGLVHLERGDVESAIRVLEEASDRVPEESEIHRTLAIARSRQGESRSRVRTFEGHKDVVKSVMISPDGRWVLSGSLDGTLRMWDLTTGKQVRIFDLEIFKKTTSSISLSISPDSRWALSAVFEHIPSYKVSKLALWELATGRCANTFWLKEERVKFITFSPDGRMAFSAATDTLGFLELATGKRVRTFEGLLEGEAFISISPDGRWAISLGGEGLKLWELATGKCIRTFDRDSAQSTTVCCISPDGRWALSGGVKNTLLLWELATGKCIRTFEGHDPGRWGNVTSVSISSDNRWGLSGSWDRTMRLWELATGRCVRTFKGHKHWVNSVTFSPDGSCVLSGSQDETLRLYHLGNVEPHGSLVLSLLQNAIEEVRLKNEAGEALKKANIALKRGLPSEAAVEVARARELDGYEKNSDLLECWREIGKCGERINLAEGWYLRMFKGHMDKVISVSISPDCRLALSGSQDKTLRLWQLATGKCVRTFEGHTYQVNSVCFSPDGRWALSGSEDRTMMLWDLATGKCVRKFEGDMYQVNSVCFSPDGRWALSGSNDGKLRLWELAAGRCVRIFEGHMGMLSKLTSVNISPDCRWALSGSWDRTMRLWEVATGRCMRTFKGHTNWVNSVSISPDGRWALSGSQDETMRLWELATGRCMRTFEGHTSGVTSVSISPDGFWALSGSEDRTMRLWDLSTGECVRTFEGHTAFVNSVSISPDGRWALSGSDDKMLRLWEFVWNYEFPEPVDWDEGVRPYLEVFLTLHCPYGEDGISKIGKLSWNDEDLEKLLKELKHQGYGWVRAEGIRKELERMTNEWKELPPLREVKKLPKKLRTAEASSVAKMSPSSKHVKKSWFSKLFGKGHK